MGRFFDAWERAKAGISGIKEASWRKIEDANYILDMETVNRYYAMIAEDEGVSIDEARQMCIDVPKYSMGLKMASPSVIIMLKMPHGKEVFSSWLTPEELIEWEKVKDLDYGKLIRKEKRKQKKQKKTV